MFTSPSDIAFEIGTVSVYYYGIIMAAAIVVAIFVSDKIAKHFYSNVGKDVVLDVAPFVIIGGILGARLYYCILSLDFYIIHPFEIFKIWHGGLSIQGALLGGTIAGWFYTKRHKLSFLKLADIFVYGVILGQAIGRWGNFFNSEAFGTPTTLPWGVFIPSTNRPIEFLGESYFHPTFLYESILNIIIFLILFFIVRKLAKNLDGIVFASYLILYSIARIFIEQIRIDSVLYIWQIPVAQVVCLITIAAAAALIVYIVKKSEKRSNDKG